jgi:hypothetical protein
MIALALALLASTQVLGPDMLDLSWVRAGSGERVWRELVPGHRPRALELISLAPDASSAALREKEKNGFLILPGKVWLPKARAAVFSPDSRMLAAAYASGEIVSSDLKGESPETLGTMRGVERLAWGKGVVAASRSGAVLLPDVKLTAVSVRELVAAGDRIALATASSLLLFDGSGRLLLRVRVKASALTLSRAGVLAYAAGKEVWLIDSGMKPRRLAAGKSAIHTIVFDGEMPVWLANGAQRADGKRLECARSLAAANQGLLASCGDRVVNWDGDAQRILHREGECYVSIDWALPLGDGFLVAILIHDRRFLPGCGNLLLP